MKPLSLSLPGAIALLLAIVPTALAQMPLAPPITPGDLSPPSNQALPEPTPNPTPSNVPVLPSPAPARPPAPVDTTPTTLTVTRFEFQGNTAFSAAALTALIKDFLNRPLSQTELLSAVPAAITKYYTDNGYKTSGAIIPEQQFKDGVVQVEIIEGDVEAIDVQPANGTRSRLHPNYIRSRLALATRKPVNYNRLLEALQLLQLDPRIRTIAAELTAGSTSGRSLLKVTVAEADPASLQVGLDNGRSPSVGSFRRQVSFSHNNLLGLGDTLGLAYANTVGSNALDLSYTLPINPRNGTLNLSGGFSFSNVVEEPFRILDIQARSNFIELTYRQPLLQTPTQEIAVGFSVGRRFSSATLVDGEIPFPTAGSDALGKTRVTTVRFFQELSKRNKRSALALRSQFTVGLDALGATSNETAPDGRFLAWRGQAQWVRLLAPETPLVVRGDVQFADRALVPFEQLGLGGAQSVRGYRQDALLADNGLFASAEVRLPILRLPNLPGLLQVAPFIEVGTGWNRDSPDPDPSTIASVGIGLRLQVGDTLTARLDWGIPLISVSGEKRTWQENGVYFSIVYTPF